MDKGKGVGDMLKGAKGKEGPLATPDALVKAALQGADAAATLPRGGPKAGAHPASMPQTPEHAGRPATETPDKLADLKNATVSLAKLAQQKEAAKQGCLTAAKEGFGKGPSELDLCI